jgi:argininosuccinate lyase
MSDADKITETAMSLLFKMVSDLSVENAVYRQIINRDFSLKSEAAECLKREAAIQSRGKFQTLWRQVLEAYRSQDHPLLFEKLGEVRGLLSGD